MPDLLVKLYDLDFDQHPKEYFEDDYKIVRALPLDKSKILKFIDENFDKVWVDECEKSFSNQPVSCFIAVKEKKVIGFACYDATALGFFGPTGVEDQARGVGIGKKLLFSCLKDMWDNEYAYAVIGWTTDRSIDFYKKSVGAIEIPDSYPGIYKRMVDY